MSHRIRPLNSLNPAETITFAVNKRAKFCYPLRKVLTMSHRRLEATGGRRLTEDEIELVADLLAKIGGTWHPDQTRQAPRPISRRHRDIARLIVGAVERSRAKTQSVAEDASVSHGSGEARTASRLCVGSTVVYSPPGDQRTLTCRIERMDNGRAYVVPTSREIGWVSTHTLLPLKQDRDTASRPRLAPAETPEVGFGVSTHESVIEFAGLTSPGPRLRFGEVPNGVQHYFSSSGQWIAYRRNGGDRYLFDRQGNWIGWFPWNDNDAVDLNGEYLGTVVDENRLYRSTSPQGQAREVGFVTHPGRSGYPGFPGPGLPCVSPLGFKDIDLTQLPSGRRFWLKGAGRDGMADREPNTFQIWMSKVGLGHLASWIERVRSPTKP